MLYYSAMVHYTNIIPLRVALRRYTIILCSRGQYVLNDRSSSRYYTSNNNITIAVVVLATIPKMLFSRIVFRVYEILLFLLEFCILILFSFRTVRVEIVLQDKIVWQYFERLHCKCICCTSKHLSLDVGVLNISRLLIL